MSHERYGGVVMPREASLFESADGSILKGYRLLQRGGANIPPMWIQRASESRCRLHKDVAQALRRKSKAGLRTLKEGKDEIDQSPSRVGTKKIRRGEEGRCPTAFSTAVEHLPLHELRLALKSRSHILLLGQAIPQRLHDLRQVEPQLSFFLSPNRLR